VLDRNHHVAEHIELRIKLRLLRQVAHLRAFSRPSLAGEFLLHPGHDLEQGRLTGPVQPDHADLHARIERQPNIFQNLFAAGIGLPQLLHHVNILIGGHRDPPLSILCRNERAF
jgi:hypothetical protein